MPQGILNPVYSRRESDRAMCSRTSAESKGGQARTLAEVAAKRDLRLIVEMLVAEDEDRVLVERLPDRAEVLARYRRRQVDAGHLGDEERVQAVDGESGLERSDS